MAEANGSVKVTLSARVEDGEAFEVGSFSIPVTLATPTEQETRATLVSALIDAAGKIQQDMDSDV